MNALNLMLTNQRSENGLSSLKRIGAVTAKWSEAFWFCLTFLLFLVMGPFSVIAVFFGLWSLSKGENRDRMVEPGRY